MSECNCPRIKLGSKITNHKNWSPDCAEHGTNSKWWNSAEQVLKREVDSTRLRDLQQKAKEARLKAKNIDNV